MEMVVSGTGNDGQDQILHGGMRDKLAETHRVVSKTETKAAIAKAIAETGDDGCMSDECLGVCPGF